MECIALIVLAVLVLATVQAGLRWSRASVLSSLADQHEGWTFDGRALRGPVGDGAVVLTVSPSWADPSWSVAVLSEWMDVRVVRPPAHVVLPGAVDTGDKRLDRAVAIEGRSRVVLATLSPEARKVIRRAIARGFTCEGGAWSFRSGRFSRSRDELQTALAIAAELALQLEPPGDVSAALEARLAEESDPSVALEMLRARLEDSAPLSEALRTQLLARRDATTLLLARSMEAGGDHHIAEVMQHAEDEGTRWEALGMLWGQTDKHPGLPAALATFLDSRWSETAIRRLTEVGTVKEVPALREVTERWFDARGKAAEKAIQAIQARARGSVGQLSLAEASLQEGAVSLVQEESPKQEESLARRAARSQQGQREG